MAQLHVITFFACSVLGIFAAFWTGRLFWGASYLYWLFHPLGACLYLAAGIGLFLVHVNTMPSPKAGFDPVVAFSMVGKVFFLGLPFGVYLGCLIFRVGSTFFAFSGPGDHDGLPNHMEGDAAVAARNFDHAISCYQATLTKWPGDLGTLLRLSRAYESAGKFPAAQTLLEEARAACMPAELGGPPYGEHAAFTKESQDRLAALTVALSGFHSDVYANKAKARELCMEILPYLTANTAAQPVKDRLAKLNKAA